MNEKENYLDELFQRIDLMEDLTKKYLRLISDENNKLRIQNPISSKDFTFSQNKINQFERKIENYSKELIEYARSDKEELYRLIEENDHFSNYSLEWILKAISCESSGWLKYVEKAIIRIIDNLEEKTSYYSIDHLYALMNDLPPKFFGEESKAIKRMVLALQLNDPKLVYCIQYYLWNHDYCNSIVIAGFEKNLRHTDWRIRLITFDYLATWKREYKLVNLRLPNPSISDRVRSFWNKDYEMKLI